MIFGKLIGGLLGLLTLGPIGAILGLLAGHAFDRGLGKSLVFTSPENVARIQQSFFETIFLLLGYLAKADGRVSEAEIAHTESLFSQMGLSAEQRRKAIALFRRGSAADFDLQGAVRQFVDTCGPQRQLQQTLLMFLVTMALADGQLDALEHAALRQIAMLMGFGAAPLEQLLRMAQAQEQFHSGRHGAQGINALEQAYTALGVDAGVSDQELKRAYRRLMSENHPDKLIARGLPDDMVKLATEKSQEIQSAYELIRKSRSAA